MISIGSSCCWAFALIWLPTVVLAFQIPVTHRSIVANQKNRQSSSSSSSILLLFYPLNVRQQQQQQQPQHALFAKPKPNQSNESTQLVRPDRPTAAEMPANLRRKVNAKRPPLGHIVPKTKKQNGRQQQQQQQRGGTAGPQLRPQGKAREAGLNNPGMLKISSGTARGRRLDSPNVYLRPMMGKVREAVFSTLTSFGLYDPTICKSTRHLDIFSGSGSVGLESLSRGAAHCTFVDLSADCCACAQRNIGWCGFDTETNVVVQADAIQALTNPVAVGIPEGSKYQIVTLCPPYEEVVYADLLEAVAFSDLVTDDTVVMIEYPVELGCLPHVIAAKDGGAMVGVRNRKYGRTVIAMYVVNPTGKLDDSASSRPEEFVSL